MADTFTTSLSIRQIETGTRSGTWGTETNTQYELLDNAFSYVNHDLASDADATLTISDGTASDARYFYIKFTSSVSLTATRSITLAPDDSKKIWIVENATTGSQSLTFKQGSSGGTVTVVNGNTAVIYADGAGATNGAITNALNDLQIDGNLTVDTDTLYVDSSNNRVGVGTTSPNTALQVSSTVTTKSVVETTGASSDALIEFTKGQGSGNTWSIGLDQSNSSALSFAYLSNGSPSLTSHGKVTVDTSGNVGIGTTSPSVPLDVAGKGIFSGAGSFEALELITSDANRVYITGNSSVSGDMWRIGTSASNQNLNIDTLQATGEMVFRINGTEKVRIDSSGNVGIGTSSPTATLVVQDNSFINIDASDATYPFIGSVGSSSDDLVVGSWGDVQICADINGTSGQNIIFKEGGSGASGTELMRIATDGRLQFANLTATNTDLSIFAKSNYLYAMGGTAGAILADDANQSNRILLSNSGNYVKIDTSGTERMRINSSGHILAGTTSGAAGNKAGQIVADAGIITTEAEITTTNGTVDVTVPSGGIMITAQSGYVDDAAIFTFKSDGGSQGCFGLGIGNSAWAFGTTSEPAGLQRNKVWVQTTNTLRFKDNGYGARTYQLTILSNTA